MTANTVTKKDVNGGRAGGGGSASKSVGGGVSNLWTFTFDVATVIAKKKASTSNDDLFT